MMVAWVVPVTHDEPFSSRFAIESQAVHRFNTALEAARRTRLLITVGTVGTSTLPNHYV